MILENEDSNQSGNDYYGAIRNTAVQKYGRKFMGEINEIKKLWTNKIYLVSFVGDNWQLSSNLFIAIYNEIQKTLNVSILLFRKKSLLSFNV